MTGAKRVDAALNAIETLEVTLHHLAMLLLIERGGGAKNLGPAFFNDLERTCANASDDLLGVWVALDSLAEEGPSLSTATMPGNRNDEGSSPREPVGNPLAHSRKGPSDQGRRDSRRIRNPLEREAT